LRGTAAEFPNDAELPELGKLAEDGVQRKAEADRLITESRELFAQRKSAEAIQLLRKAYELDKNNSLCPRHPGQCLGRARPFRCRNRLVGSRDAGQAGARLEPCASHCQNYPQPCPRPKKTSSVEDWVSQARKLQSSGDLFAALAWVAEGLAVHPNHPKLIQIQDEIQRDQGARRRRSRRRDFEDLRRMEWVLNYTDPKLRPHPNGR